MANCKNGFKTRELGNILEYSYDITNYIQDFLGDIVESADIRLGFIFLTDSEEKQEKDKERYMEEAIRIDSEYEKTHRFVSDSDRSIYIHFINGKAIRLSTLDYAEISNANENE